MALVKATQVKNFGLLTRRPDVTDEFFEAHWVHPHGTLVKGMTPLRGYVQCHRIASGLPGVKGSPYDGIAITWFDDLQAAQSMGDDPVYQQQVRPDELLFIDPARLAFVTTDEYFSQAGRSQADDGNSAAKAMLLVRRLEALAPADFRTEILAAAGRLPGVVRATTQVALSIAAPVNYEGGSEPAHDAIIEFWFPDAETFASAWAGLGALASLDGIADQQATVGDLYEELRLVAVNRDLK